jgi:hypothetical protein
MKLLARILSHGFAIAVVLLLAIGLIYRGELFPEYNLPDFLEIGKLADHQKESTTGQVARDEVAAQPEAPAPATAPATADAQDQAAIQRDATEITAETDTGDGTTSGVAAVAVLEPGPAEAEVTLQETAGPDTEQPAPASETEASSVMMEEVVDKPEEEPATGVVAPLPGEAGQQSVEEAPEDDVPPPGESAATTAPGLTETEVIPGEVPESTEPAALPPESETVTAEAAAAAEPASRPQEKAYQLLAEAREAYWLRDYDTAESKYLSLTRLEAGNPDGYGELGNMYFSQGKWDQAATAYYEAGVRLVGQGLLTQAEELLAVIRGLNGAHADELEQKIADTRSAVSQ